MNNADIVKLGMAFAFLIYGFILKGVKMRSLFIFLTAVYSFFVFSQITYASSSYIDRNSFFCSDGNFYDVARVYNDDPSMDSWGFIAFCASNTMSLTRYPVFIKPEEAQEDIKNCLGDNSSSRNTCFAEFKKLNKLEGDGLLPKIVHNPHRQPPVIQYVKPSMLENSIIIYRTNIAE